MRSGAADTYAMGAELTWLAGVLPAAAQGNLVPFNTTGTQRRLYLRQVAPMMEAIINMDPRMKEVTRQALKDTNRTFGPRMEQNIVGMAILLAGQAS